MEEEEEEEEADDEEEVLPHCRVLEFAWNDQEIRFSDHNLIGCSQI
jgi:hypothetical protein